LKLKKKKKVEETVREEIKFQKEKETLRAMGFDNEIQNGNLLEKYHGKLDKVVEILLKSPTININKSNNLGNSPLHFASYNGHKKIIELLILNPSLDAPKKKIKLAAPQLNMQDQKDSQKSWIC